VIWHTPLLAYGAIPWYDFVFGIFALQIIFTWLYNGSGASVLIAMIAHLFSNVMTAKLKPLFRPADQERYWLIMIAVEFFVALGLLIATRGRLGLKPTSERVATRDPHSGAHRVPIRTARLSVDGRPGDPGAAHAQTVHRCRSPGSERGSVQCWSK
jgi:hypothetical protein